MDQGPGLRELQGWQLPAVSTRHREQSAIPFLKWAGGKRWLMPLAAELKGRYSGKYLEPFLGSGAMFFALGPDRAVLSDANGELVETYRTLRDAWAEVVARLREHSRRHSTEYYYRMRSSKPRSAVGRAARFIYLNRTCWNGLYRVNRQGVFNVPIGTKDSVLLESDNFSVIAGLLANAAIEKADFEETISKAKKGDLVFADPPYTVRHQYNGFVKYNQQLFSWEDQERLHKCLVRARARGAHVVCTNADHESIRTLYGRDFHITGVSRFSSIAGRGGTRGNYAEVLIHS